MTENLCSVGGESQTEGTDLREMVSCRCSGFSKCVDEVYSTRTSKKEQSTFELVSDLGALLVFLLNVTER